MIRPWLKTASRPLGDFRIFRLRSDRKVSPRTGESHDFVVLECVDWVNIIAVTPDNQLVMLEQFRHGTDTVELEIPGGVMDPQDLSPVDTAIRELREETGYQGESARVLAKVFTNPAILTNTCHIVIIENCVLTHPTEWDSGEDLITRLVPVPDLPGLVSAEKIRHSLVVVALFHFDLWRRGEKRG